MTTDNRTGALLAKIIDVTKSHVTFQRPGEAHHRRHLILASSEFPFNLLVPGDTYIIQTQQEDGYWLWVDAHTLGERVAPPTVTYKKPRL